MSIPHATRQSSAALPRPPLPAAATRWALFLDVDGTLLNFVDDPAAVRISPSLLQLLRDLHSVLDGALALVSGRALDDLDRIFLPVRWASAGLHGLELRHADGSSRRITAAEGQHAHLLREARSLTARFQGVQVEDKQVAVALHCRRAPNQWPALRDAATALLAQLPGYEMQPGDHVIELKPAGMDKGRAVAQLMQQPPFAGRQPVYLGDDLTDEHGFATVNTHNGISVRIGQREPSQARFTLPDPAATAVWLTSVLDALTQGASTHVRLTQGPSANQP